MRIISIILIIAAAASACGCGGEKSADPAAARALVTVTLTNSERRSFDIIVETAVTRAERAAGLSNRDSLAAGRGMFFVFEDESMHMFWMKDTRIPLDMIYISSAGVIVDINRSAAPYSLTPFLPSAPAKYVLEVNGGWCGANNVVEGDSVMIPAGY